MQKRTFASARQLRTLAEKYSTPFHLYDEAGIRKTARDVRRAFSWNAGYREYYAVKACPNPTILSLLREEGCGVDCSSMAELVLARACGFHGDEIMFSSNETPGEEFKMARALDANINLDDITHVDVLAENGGIPEFVCLRYNPGGTLTFSETCMGQPGEAKFGMTRDQIFESVRLLRARGAKRFGLHALLASNALANEYYYDNALVLFELAAALKKELGADIDMVNLSGGIGIPYTPEEPMPDIFEIGRSIERAYQELLVPAGLQNVRITMELGRYMTGPHGCLVTRAIREKHIYRDYIGLDACAADLMRPAMYGAYHHATVVGKEDAPCDHVYDLVGALCENNDKFAWERPLPKIDIGDIVVIHDTGAHGHSMGYNYNGRLRSAEVLLCQDGSDRLIRRAETLRDYFATLDVSDYDFGDL